MKTIVLFIILLITVGFLKSQSVQWVKKGSSEGFENGNAIVADDSGNVYVTGQIEYTSLFDSYSLPTYGQHDIIVAKYSPGGSIIWIRYAGGVEGDIGLGIGIDSKHNVYVTGEVEQTAHFGNGVSLTSSGGNDGFLAKYDVNGNVVWARKFGASSSSDKGRALAVSPSGNCYITGNFSATSSFGSTTLSSNGGNDVFVVKYNTSGSVEWAKRAGGSKQDRGFGIAIDGSENVYVTGSFTSPATFRNTTVTNTGKLSSFLAKYNSGGTLQWVKAGGDCCDTTQAHAVALDNSGNVFITGYFGVKTKFSSTTLTSSGMTDIFIAKYSNSGSLKWAKKIGGTKEDIGYGITYNPLVNRIYVTGYVASAGYSGNISYPFAGYKDVFLGSFSASTGSEKWATTYGGHWRDVGLALTVNSQGNIYLTGLFNGTAQFGPVTMVSYPNSYWADFFVAKISPPPGLSPTDEGVTMNEPQHFSPVLNTGSTFSENSLDNISAYPNPFSDKFIINSAAMISIQIYDLEGRIVEHKEYINGELILGNEMQQGIYYVVLTDGISRRTMKLVKTD